MKTSKLFLQHYLNPVPVFCRAKDFGISDRKARKLMKWYERTVFSHLIKPIIYPKPIICK